MSIEANGARASAELETRFDLIQSTAGRIGLVGLAACVAGAVIAPAAFFPSYLAAFLLWTGVSFASIGLCLLHQLTGGSWAVPHRRSFEAAGSLIVLMALFFVPILLGLGYTYAWADKAVVDANHHVANKVHWLNPGSFTLRAVIYFAIATAAAYIVNAWSRQQDDAADKAPSRRLNAVAGPATVFMFLTASFASFDWGMSRDPDWYSTIYGALFIVGSILSTLALAAVFSIRNGKYEPIHSALTVGRLNDLGNLMLAFTMLWAYMSFSQFLITWLGNLPEEVVYYQRRVFGIYGAIALGLIAFGFFAPFLALLQRSHKRDANWILPIASWILVMRAVDLFWVIVPGFGKIPGPHGEEGDSFAWGSLLWYAAALAGVGGIWVAAFIRRLRTAPLVPLRDPRVVEALERDRAHAHAHQQHTGGAVL
ncbi:hypothetical protein [Paludisphaera rhizosphaerae]|uniref:hypothetical protein n=1 Tax=Paludisphaera rhizosphaerae TaxID=2711216 RepID=UPI0013ECCEEE|nr:hypothetical protein [Paludisphaera rhizosphaerae]